MPDQTVPTDPGEPTGYAATAAELRRIADTLDTLPPVDKPSYAEVSILPEHTAEAVDAVALALIGKTGYDERAGDGTWRRTAHGGSPALWINVHATVPGPPDEKDVELERLRTELTETRAWIMRSAQIDSLPPHWADYGRDVDNGDASAEVPGGVEGGPVTGRDCVTRYFSFGIGQTDPATGEKLRNKYVTVIAPTAEGCREAMLASRFGRDWSMEYIPGRPDTDERIPQWTEHERIVVDPVACRCPGCECGCPECECDTSVPCGEGSGGE